MKVNITCGEIANNYYSSKYNNEIFIPFNEAMIYGNPKENIFSEEFILERLKTHNTSLEDYMNKMKGILSLKDNLEDLEITCWFGDDLFCEVNLLILLAYLDQNFYRKKVVFNLIDEETYDIKNTSEIDVSNYKVKYLENILRK